MVYLTPDARTPLLVALATRFAEDEARAFPCVHDLTKERISYN